MFNIGPEEIILMLVVALIFVGPKRLPEVARQIGKGLREFRSLSSQCQARADEERVGRSAPCRSPVTGRRTLPAWDGTKDGSRTATRRYPRTVPRRTAIRAPSPAGSRRRSRSETPRRRRPRWPGRRLLRPRRLQAPSAAPPTVELPAASSSPDGPVATSDAGEPPARLPRTLTAPQPKSPTHRSSRTSG